MKKVLALLLAGVLVLGMSMTVFASPSNETGTTTEDAAAKEEVTNNLDGVLDEAGVEEDADDVIISGIFGANTLPTANSDGYIYHTVEVEGLEKGDTAYILAYIDGEWVNVTTEIVDGKISGKFPAAVPYVVITDKDVKADVDDGDSPKTGEAAVVPVLVVVAAAAAGMAVTTRRRTV